MDKINFKNLPDTSTPLNASNMNLLQTNIENEINGLIKYKKFDISFDVSNSNVGDFVVGITNNTIPSLTGYSVVGFVVSSVTYSDANYIVSINNKDNYIYALLKLGYRGSDITIYMSGYIMYVNTNLVDNTSLT